MKCMSVLIFLFLVMQCASSGRTSSSSDPQCVPPRLKNGRSRTKGRGGRIIRYSCSADFELVGNRYSTCSRGTWDTPTPICVSTRCQAPAVPKHAMVGETYKGALLMYFCEPGYKLVGNSQIYCDGRQWNATTPYCRDTKSVAPTSCDFEKEGLCWWEQDPKHDFDWLRHQFDTPSSHIGTGPTHDHTLGAGYDGYYMFIESSGRLINDTARLLSPLYGANLTDSGCFSFWYHMYGATIGSLNVYFKPETEKTARLMWTMSGNQGNQWKRGFFDLPAVNTSFQLIIEGVRGASYVSDIAIDDLALLQGDQCSIKNITASSPPPPSETADEVEIVNGMQTCRNRCVNSLTESTPSAEIYSNSDLCMCTVDCADTGSCCPDFAEYCIFEATDLETVIPLTRDAINASTESAIINSTIVISSSNSTKSEKFDDESTTIQASKSTRATYTIITQKIPFTAKETTDAVETKAASGPMNTATTIASVNVETPFFSNTTVHETPAPTEYETPPKVPHVIQNSQRLNDESESVNLSSNFGLVSGILSALAITGLAALVILRRRHSYKRSSNGSAYSDDSDVRFLTSDEVLDFGLAKPADDD